LVLRPGSSHDCPWCRTCGELLAEHVMNRGIMPTRNNGSEDNKILPDNSGQSGSSDNQGRMDSTCSPVS
jgi:hypothetical protein